MINDKEVIISKIRKVLALATNNPSKEEGENAMLLAQKTMIENNIASSDIKEISSKEVVDEAGYSAQKAKWWHGNLAVIIANNFKCFVYIEHLRYPVSITNIKFLGLKEDVGLAKTIYLYAISIIDHTSKKYASEHKGLNSLSQTKNQYILGFLSGLKSKFAEQIQKNDWGLIIVKDALVITAQKKLHLRTSGHSNARMGNDSNARDAGYTQGKQFTPIMGNLTEGK